MAKFFTRERRKWIYNIAIAVLVILGGYGIINAVEMESYTQLVVAILDVGGAAAFALARNNLTPKEVEDSTEGEDPVDEAHGENSVG